MGANRIPESRRHSVYPGARSAVGVLADMTGMTREHARDILKGLVEAGYIIAPREPNNAMLEAYMSAIGNPARRRDTLLNNIGKARKRWQAMGTAGVRVALSQHQFIDQHETPFPHSGREDR